MVALRAFLVSLSLPTLVIFSAGLPSNNISMMGNSFANNDSVNTTVLGILPQKNIVFDTQTTEEPGGKGRLDPGAGRIDPGGVGRIS